MLNNNWLTSRQTSASEIASPLLNVCQPLYGETAGSIGDASSESHADGCCPAAGVRTGR